MVEKARPLVFIDGQKKQAKSGMDLAPLATGTAPGFMSGADKAKIESALAAEFHQSADGALFWFESEVLLFQLTSIEPTSGAEGGGTEFTITGTGFRPADAATVTFGTEPATGVTVVDSTTITGTTPAGEGTVNVTVTQGDDSDTLEGAFEYRLWTPADIATAEWLDAGDSATITLDGSSKVSDFDDKSGNVRHYTQPTSANRPTIGAAVIGGLDVIVFDGTDDVLAGPSSVDIARNRAEINVFMVAGITPNSGTGFQRAYNYSISGSTNTSFRAGLVPRNDTLEAWQRQTSGDSAQNVNIPYSTKSNLIIQVRHSWINAEVGIRTNAGTETVAATGHAAANSNDADSVEATIGGENLNKVQFAAMDFGERVVVIGSVTTDTREKIEGYFAHRWGLEANLPAGHPYKASPP